ncbi:MAG TPA: BMP family ABC transporter substrate-binding protein [Candidatus Limiplasma sp.]|nr:BMP family ABC transporter substrate-binding protein [Candidatus Limiplasma sp.]HPS80556.1 BMP family ABC transporter substrate-binding protein [Candidatus Limiplasma sp.]
MKKVIAILLTLALVVAMGVSALAEGTYEIAMVTDVGNIDDHSFNQATWEGVKAYAEANGITYNYYRPSEDSNEARVESMKAAIEKGAKAVVTPGYLFADSVAEVSAAYPDVSFLLVDTAPSGTPLPNTYSISYKEEQSGYFAGYAAVKDGYKKLGFLGGMAVPAVVRYGYGFVQGADAAAKELGLTDVEIKYWYCGGFGPTDDIKIKMDGWYTEGVEVVFACGGKIYQSAIAAAEAANGKVIGVDVDQAYDSDLIITSAMKDLKNSIVLALTDLYANGGTWGDKGGTTVTLGAAEDCTGLPTAEGSWRFKTFTVDEYNALYAKVKSGEVVVNNSTDAAPTVTNVTVDYQE